MEEGRLITAKDGLVGLTDAGWYWCGQELRQRPDEELDDPVAGVLYAVLRLIVDCLEATDMALGEFVLVTQPGEAFKACPVDLRRR